MAWVEKNGSKWRGFYRDHRGAKRSKTFPRKREAQQWATRQEHQRVDLSGDLILFEDFWESYWPSRKATLSPKSIALETVAARTQLMPVFGHVILQDIDSAMIQRWVDSMFGEGKSSETCRSYALKLKVALNHAAELKLIASNPFNSVKMPAVKSREMMFLEPEQLRHLASRAGYYETFILFLGTCGLRFGEAAALRPSSFSDQMTKVSVARNLVETPSGLIEGAPKTSAGRRTVGVPEPLARRLCQFSDEVGHIEYFFETPAGFPMRSSSFHHQVWSKIKHEDFAGLRVHDLRHTAISMWINLGADPKLVAHMAGHSSTQRVFDVYGHLYKNADDELMKGLSRALG